MTHVTLSPAHLAASAFARLPPSKPIAQVMSSAVPPSVLQGGNRQALSVVTTLGLIGTLLLNQGCKASRNYVEAPGGELMSVYPTASAAINALPSAQTPGAIVRLRPLGNESCAVDGFVAIERANTPQGTTAICQDLQDPQRNIAVDQHRVR